MAVVAMEVPSVVMDEVVAAFAQQGEIVDVGGPTSAEPLDVVGLVSLGRRGAVDAPAVAGGQHDPLAGACVSLGPPQPKRVR